MGADETDENRPDPQNDAGNEPVFIATNVEHIQVISHCLLYIPLEGDLTSKYTLFKNEAFKMPGVKDITHTTSAPTKINNGTTGVLWEEKGPNSKIEFTQVGVGYDFIKTLHIQMLEGRDFSKDIATDSLNYIINETALKIIGYKNPISKPLTLWKKKGTIIGVVKDFHFNSLHEAINPLILHISENFDGCIALVKTEPGKTKEALASLEKVYKDLNPKVPFTYKFSDEEYQKLYKSEQVVSELANYFAFLSIFISCLGLLGLVMFTAEQHTKEFGIRKVLGASSFSLFRLLSKEFILLVLAAMIIASPLAWYLSNQWLQDFAYRINIGLWMFALAGIFIIAVAMITTSFQAIKVAIANPVKSLRME